MIKESKCEHKVFTVCRKTYRQYFLKDTTDKGRGCRGFLENEPKLLHYLRMFPFLCMMPPSEIEETLATVSMEQDVDAKCSYARTVR